MKFLFLLFFIVVLVCFIFFFWILKLKRKNKELYQENLLYAQRLEDAMLTIEKKEKFLSHASHELRTPMTAIMGLTHLVLENELPAFQKEYIQKIQISAEHLLSIINDILDLSKIQAGKLHLEQEEFNLDSIVDYVINIISIQAKKNKLFVDVTIAQDVPSHLLGDSLRLGQILINLLANAVKFTQRGSVILDVKKRKDFTDGVVIEFSITDTGIGMTQEQIKKIFTSYTQAEISTSRKFGGTGLGLSISKQLVEMMDGSIYVESTQNVGSTFRCVIPFRVKDSENKRQYRLSSSKFLHKRVLIIDSSNKEGLDLVKAFTYFHYKSRFISSFDKLILEEASFDIVVIDQKSINENTITKLKALKKYFQNEVKIVLLYEIQNSINPTKFQEIQVDAYLKAPFTQQNILNLILELYEQKTVSQKEKLSALKARKILVAEDNILNHKIIAGLLSDTAMELSFVEDGKEVLELLKKDHSFDLILMDINMPNINGYEATKEIRKDQKYDAISIVALTADTLDISSEMLNNIGMQGYLTKPIVVEKFYNKLFDIFTSSALPKENAQQLSIDVGLSRCNNDKEFYKSILKDFKNIYCNSALELQSLCEGKQYEQAKKKAIDIKDVALSIGAYNLCKSIATMEYEFEKALIGDCQESLSSYSQSLEKLFFDIDTYLSLN